MDIILLGAPGVINIKWDRCPKIGRTTEVQVALALGSVYNLLSVTSVMKKAPTITFGLALLFTWLPSEGRAQGGLSPHDRPLQIRLQGLFMDLDTSIRVDGRTLRGTTMALEDDFGLAQSPVFPAIDLSVGMLYRIHLTAFYSIREGDETVDQNVKFNGGIIAIAGDTVEVRSELFTMDLFLASPIYRKQTIQINFISGIKYLHLRHEVDNVQPTDPNAIDTTSSTDTVDVPGLFLGVGGHLNLSQFFTLYSRFHFSKYAWDAFQTEKWQYIEFIIGVTYMLWPGFSLSLDYRILSLEVAEDNGGHRSVYDIFGNGIGFGVTLAF